MSTKLQEIRKRLQQNAEKQQAKSTMNKLYYPFWDMSENQNATVRFLPNLDPEEPVFWASEKCFHLPFAAPQGEAHGTTITVPCMESFGKPCRVLNEVRKWWKDKSHTPEQRSAYWAKEVYYYPAVVIESPLNEDGDVPLLRVLRFKKSLSSIVNEALMDDDFFDEMPSHFEHGTNFIIRVKKRGQWKDYTSSGFARKPSALDEQTIEELRNELINPASLISSCPSPEQEQEIWNLFTASVEGEVFENDNERWPNFLRKEE